MKFIVFNIVVAVALVYLVANKDNGLDVSLPKLGDVTAAAEQVLGRASAAVPQTRTEAPAPQAENPFSVMPETDSAAAAPKISPEAPLFDAPVIDKEDLSPPPVEVAAAEVPAAKVPSAEAPQPLDPAVAQRRAEVLGETAATPSAPVQLITDRRRRLLDLAEEMEYLAAEFSVQ
jgi:hypothetical protein